MTPTNGRVCVIGAGIFGLSVAWAARRRGFSVRLIEARAVAAGASGGVVGALSPHVPDQWNPKKQFQLEALSSAAEHWRQIDAVSGIDSGYGRTGRLMPLASAATAELAAARAADADRNWGSVAKWNVIPDHSLVPHRAAPFGMVFETLSARIFPRRACLSLAEALRRSGVEITENTAADAVSCGRVSTRSGDIHAEYIVLAAGVQGFDLMAPLLGEHAGQGVKGQAALLHADLPRGSPVLFDNGVYVIPHADGTVAVGSTSENTYQTADTTDHQLDALLRNARNLCPHLSGAQVVARWAQARPKARRRDPMLGPIAGHPGVFVATGAFKIGFGIAHKVGKAVVDMLAGTDPAIPQSFGVEHHLE
ncbi:MAG: FAD-binding oxidoreductase [Pseudomonadota bacterium]